jgi:hypothetical protein
MALFLLAKAAKTDSKLYGIDAGIGRGKAGV